MATSESEPDFESADEEQELNNSRRGNNNTATTNTTKRRTTIGSDSDDDEDFIPSPKQQNLKKMDSAKKTQHKKSSTAKKKTPAKGKNEEKPSEDKSLMQELQETEDKTKPEQTNRSPEVPDELKSDLKFKDIFKPDGWEGLDDDVELPDSLSDDKYRPVLDKLASVAGNRTPDDVVDSWSTWGSWGVSSLINTATAGVSNVTSQVSRGLTLLEETMGIQDPEELAQAVMAEEAKNSENTESEKTDSEKKLTTEEEEEKSESNNSVVGGFGFGNFLKLVESTSSRVISGGLDTLETIGKKTMEVLQDGDPGLKKKRAFFFEEGEKPILSQVLREAKEKADVEEKSAEEKQMARKVHFESIFDDFQGLVHLEALEMLSKQCNIKIQQKLVDLEGDELSSLEETLDEIKELCDLGDEDEEEEVKRSFEDRLKDACQDLGIPVTFEKIVNVWNEIESSIPDPTSKDVSHLKIFQNAILAIAQFTALSVERFHKSAELLLVKERRSTVNETDALVQMTKILCHQVGQVANLFCTCLNRIKDESEKGIISRNITTTLVEATNASSYIQEGFRLLIPILQVGAI